MLRFKEYLTDIMEAKSDATTFFHEVICGIACYNPAAAKKIEKGADIRQYFKNGTISARKGSGSTTEADVTSLPQFRFMDDTVDVDGNLTSEQATKEFFDAGKMSERKNDAIKVAVAIVKRIGAPTSTVFWTGPTNDLSDYGAADIAYNEQGISLKYGKGQFKNLTVDSFARTALGSPEGSLLKELHKKVPEKWDYLCYDWMSLIGESMTHWKTGRDNESIQIKNKALKEFNNIKDRLGPDWDMYQEKKVDDNIVQVFHDLLYNPKQRSVYDKNDKKKSRTKQFRYICRKIYDQGPADIRKKWKLRRNVLFTDIFGEYFKKQDETVKKNLKTVFEKQISVGEKAIIYAAKGGSVIQRIPSKAEFDKNVDGIDFSYEGKTTGAGYTFILKAETAKESKKIMEISIFFRWKSAGQMMGNPDTSSDSKMFINDYSEIFIPE